MINQLTEAPPPSVLRVLDGAVDLHVRSGPSPFPRRFDHVEAARDAARINMRAILIESHHHNTVMDLLATEAQLRDIPVQAFGGVPLNAEVGPARTVIDSDLGQVGHPLPVDAYLHVAQQLLDHGVSERDIRQVVCRNTAYLLGLEEAP